MSIQIVSNKEDEFYMQTAFNLSKKSKCVSKKVGAVLVKDGRIISMGYNGSHPGNTNCCDIFNEHDFDFNKHHEWSRVYEVHAEMNCLSFAAKNGIKVDDCTLYVTLSPCQDCLKTLLQAGIKRIVYLIQYHRNLIPDELMTYMNSNHIVLQKLEPLNMFFSKSDCIKFLRYKKTSLHSHLRDSIKYHTSFIPDKDLDLKREFQQRTIHLKNNLIEVPKCKFSHSIQDFDKNGYIGMSVQTKKINNRLKSSKLASWISLEFLCKDLQFNDVEKLFNTTGTASKFFMFRQSFPSNVLSHDDIFKKLLKMQYEPVLAKKMAYSINSGKTLINFIEWFKWSRIRNTINIEYFTRRGWPEPQAKKLSLEFFRKGMESISRKRELSEEYDNNFKKSRLIGLKSNKCKSKFQLDIVDQLRKRGFEITEDIRIHINTETFPNRHFLIDCKYKNCFIEINGSYWHHDILCSFTCFDDYIKELIKGKEIIEKYKSSYFVIWESDFKNGFNIDAVIQKLLMIDELAPCFYSSRVFDEMMFNENLYSFSV